VLIIEQGEIHNSGRIKEIVHQTFGDRKKIRFSVQAGNEKEWLDRFEHITKYNDRFIVEYESEYENDMLDIIKENKESKINRQETIMNCWSDLNTLSNKMIVLLWNTNQNMRMTF